MVPDDAPHVEQFPPICYLDEVISEQVIGNRFSCSSWVKDAKYISNSGSRKKAFRAGAQDARSDGVRITGDQRRWRGSHGRDRWRLLRRLGQAGKPYREPPRSSATTVPIWQRKVVVVIRERDGKTLPGVFASEVAPLHFIRTRIARGTIVYADEAGAWNELHGRFTMHRINHQEAYSLDGDIYTNNTESFFSRMRRAEIGHHHHIAGPYLARFAQESAWREDHRRDSNGSQVDRVVALAMRNKPSVDFCGYWQRSWL
jgi:hypothetical protein